MGLYDRGYYQEERSQWDRHEAARERTVVLPLIIANVAVWLLDAFSPEGQWLGERLAISAETLREPWNWWRFVTYGFVHSPLAGGNVMHLLGNMLVLWFFGRPVEQLLGRGPFLRVWFAALVVAGAGWALVHWLTGRPGYAIGASGAVSAILIIFIIRFPQAMVSLFGVIPMRAWILGVMVIAMDVLSSLNPASRVAGEAHLFGAAFGAAVDRWGWNLGWLDLSRPWSALRRFFSGGPRLRVHRPADDSLDEKADAILAKVNEQGLDSLTRRERQILERHSQQLRQRRGG